jgi:peptide deformylase
LAILRIAQMGHPVLRQIAERVDPELIATPEFQALCEDLVETMDDHDGAGLAAPQVHVPLRVVVCALSDDRDPEFFINPIITRLTEDTIRSYEGCLSVEGMRAAVDRCAHVHVQALDRDGTAKGYELKGFPAIVIQHECDHLDGILYVDRCDTRTLAFLTEYRRFGPLDELGQEDFTDEEEDVELPDEPDRTMEIERTSPAR